MGENLVGPEPEAWHPAPPTIGGAPDLEAANRDRTPIQVDLSLTLGPSYARRLLAILEDGEMVPLTIVFMSPYRDGEVRIPIAGLQAVQW